VPKTALIRDDRSLALSGPLKFPSLHHSGLPCLFVVLQPLVLDLRRPTRGGPWLVPFFDLVFPALPHTQDFFPALTGLMVLIIGLIFEDYSP